MRNARERANRITRWSCRAGLAGRLYRFFIMRYDLATAGAGDWRDLDDACRRNLYARFPSHVHSQRHSRSRRRRRDAPSDRKLAVISYLDAHLDLRLNDRCATCNVHFAFTCSVRLSICAPFPPSYEFPRGIIPRRPCRLSNGQF